MRQAASGFASSSYSEILPAVLLQQEYDLPLLLVRGDGSAAAPPRVVVRQLDWCRPAAVLPPGIGAVRDENTNCHRAARPYRPMQRRHSTLVHRIRIGASTEQISYDGRLRFRVPRLRRGLSDTRVMQWPCAAAIARADVRTVPNELLRDVGLIGCRGDVECRVALVHVMCDFLDEIRLRRATRRANGRRVHRESRRRCEQTRRAWLVAGRDRAEQLPELGVFSRSGSHGGDDHGSPRAVRFRPEDDLTISAPPHGVIASPFGMVCEFRRAVNDASHSGMTFRS